jgi:DNA-directed RNA polymerase subunit omega
MARVTVEDCLSRISNRFIIVKLASLRTRQLLQGAQTVTGSRKKNTPGVQALREIAEGKLTTEKSTDVLDFK